MSYILHIETATKACSIALSKNGDLIALEEINDGEYSHGENITLLIQKAIEKSGIEMNDLNAISVSSGPGSYTGLRIGVSTAKGICYALSIPLIAIDSLQALAQIGFEKYPNQTICPVIDARRMEVYNAIYNSNGELIKPISADIIDEHSYTEFEPFIYLGDGAEKLQEIWSNRNCKADLTIFSSAKGQVKPASEKFLKQQFEDVAYFEPFYLKDFVVGKK